jgi:glycine/D-amino acid oxidase-like deaminating enzyme/nitrite reductase/ring-hydroxylating ferredoxin subunit
MKSVWSDSCEIGERKSLRGNISHDVVIIGAGMAGLLTAYKLREKGINPIILEANCICGGVTKNTTAKITSQHNLIYAKLIKNFGLEKATQYAVANEKAIKSYAKIIKDNKIECAFEEREAYVYTLENLKKIEDEVKAAQDVGIDAEFTTKTTLPFEVLGAVKFSHQAQFNPMLFLKEISKDLDIYEHTLVTSIEDNAIITDSGKVKAKKIIVASHYPFINAPGYYFLRMHQERSYVLALENAAFLDGMYIGEADEGYSFRNYQDLLLFGGEGHRTGEKKDYSSYERLRAKAKELYPHAKEKYFWSAQDCMPQDEVPYIGYYAKNNEDLFVATGFNKWGMTSSMVASEILSDKLIGRKNEYEEIFSPSRFSIPASAKNFLVDTAQTVIHLSAEFLSFPREKLEHIERGQADIVEHNGEKVGVYMNNEGEAFFVSTRCAHLGCQLEWNGDELTWDCPCHGSRFDIKGNVVDNPSIRGLRDERVSRGE